MRSELLWLYFEKNQQIQLVNQNFQNVPVRFIENSQGLTEPPLFQTLIAKVAEEKSLSVGGGDHPVDLDILRFAGREQLRVRQSHSLHRAFEIGVCRHATIEVDGSRRRATRHRVRKVWDAAAIPGRLSTEI